jgi:large subunit ribosomal protein L25
MADYTLIAEGGRTIGSRPSGRLRLRGRVPAVVYGHGSEPLAISVDGRELRHALSTDAGLNQLLNLEVDGTRHLALARELQRRDEVISAEVPLTLVGEAKEVELVKGLVEQPLLALTIHATPGTIPSAIEIDISHLQIGDQIRVGDLALPPGVTTDVDADETVVLAVPRAIEGDDEDEASSETATDGVADGAA